mmetsp:Transcript_113726/g.178948  ORF Transcript_113726/g.178948 Transcript_113726/m.178948 type:complete len:113 (-) Transcript_113726:93-431(-)
MAIISGTVATTSMALYGGMYVALLIRTSLGHPLPDIKAPLQRWLKKAGIRKSLSKMVKSPDQEQCSICLSDVGVCVSTPCGLIAHHFHPECLESWLKMPENDSCPMCRSKLL